jgi:hypothetical protein
MSNNGKDKSGNHQSDSNIERIIGNENFSIIHERSYQPTVDELDDGNPPAEDSGSDSNSGSGSVSNTD